MMRPAPRLSWLVLFTLMAVVEPSTLVAQADTSHAALRLFRIRLDERYGYIDTTGRTIIAPRFEESGLFTGGLAPELEGKWGFIDATGTFVIAPQFEQAEGFHSANRPMGWHACGWRKEHCKVFRFSGPACTWS
jgi:hypothetical protein